MKKSFKIVAVRLILSIAKPIVVLELQDGSSLVRNPKQMLTDLQNSGRALSLDVTEFARGIEYASADARETFIDAVHALVGADGSGDISAFKAGDEYKLTAGHPLIVAGKAKEGDTAYAEADGVWIEGFLSIPLSAVDRTMKGMQKEMAKQMIALMGFTAQAPQGQVAQVNPLGDDLEGAEEVATTTEALGESAPKGKK